MNYKIYILIFAFSISSCNQGSHREKESKQSISMDVSESPTEIKKDSDTTTYDSSSNLVIKMNSKDSIEAYENKIFYETDTNEQNVIELKSASKIKAQIDSFHPRLTINYKQRINGYKVKVITEYDSSFSQQFTSVVEFSDTKGSKKHFLVYDFMDPIFNEIIYNLAKVKFNKDSTFYIDYTQIEKDKFLGYNTPFYFQDVNLDGELELVFNGYIQYCRDDHALFVYSFSQNRFLTNPPFNRMSSSAEYDFKNSTVTWHSSSACNYNGKYVYTFYRSSDDSSKFIFYLKELGVCSGNIYSTYQYNRRGGTTKVIREKVGI